jgi:hypothetical protein
VNAIFSNIGALRPERAAFALGAFVVFFALGAFVSFFALGAFVSFFAAGAFVIFFAAVRALVFAIPRITARRERGDLSRCRGS